MDIRSIEYTKQETVGGRPKTNINKMSLTGPSTIFAAAPLCGLLPFLGGGGGGGGGVALGVVVLEEYMPLISFSKPPY